MKKIGILFLLSVLLFSCRKDKTPEPQKSVKVIDKINIKKTYSGSSTIVTDRLDFEYNSNNEVSKISRFEDDVLYYSYTYVYQNNLPVSSMYDFTFGGDPVYKVTYGYTNRKYARYYDSYYNDETLFTHNAQYNLYTSSVNGNRFMLNEFDDITTRTASGNEYTFTFDTSKKGPLYNVVNKKWIPALWYGISGLGILEFSTHPVTSLFDDNLAQANPYTNTYDTDGFVTKSVFSVYNGTTMYEITYIYKSI
ncbi:hypothetical protein FAZ15_09870 [Sphingobacterium olei]|uniref:DUF4595 domain-containing protein n=1 Tax=Sphingobacterium olei TaxID=2571155 RepID=A0A4V5MMN0_9SPHI|nr:hypothetical protein [Sphingobacterium olei]TJZ61488.1 hypothetical protein FAZ15_09870 [Sphingobacterium olei]